MWKIWLCITVAWIVVCAYQSESMSWMVEPGQSYPYPSWINPPENTQTTTSPTWSVQRIPTHLSHTQSDTITLPSLSTYWKICTPAWWHDNATINWQWSVPKWHNTDARVWDQWSGNVTGSGDCHTWYVAMPFHHWMQVHRHRRRMGWVQWTLTSFPETPWTMYISSTSFSQEWHWFRVPSDITNTLIASTSNWRWIPLQRPLWLVIAAANLLLLGLGAAGLAWRQRNPTHASRYASLYDEEEEGEEREEGEEVVEGDGVSVEMVMHGAR